MGKYFSPASDEVQFASDIFDDMLEVWGKPCKLIYQGREQTCPNCLVNSRTGESTNRYKPGGPIPFESGEHCPVCDGRGRIIGTGTSDIITMTIDWTPKPWMNLGTASGGNSIRAANEGDRLVRVASGMVGTRGYITDLPKVLRADNIILDITNPYSNNKFKLNGEPWLLGSTVKNRYFGAIWERSG